MKIGCVELKSNILLAPLAGYTDVGFRRLCAEYGAGLTVTEMVSAKGLCYGNKNTENLLRVADNEKPVAVQIFGAEPEFIAKAVKHDALKKFDIIDINMGCPVNKIVRNGEGSALMKDIPLAKEIASAAVENAGKPVTVKMRSGFDENSINADKLAAALEEIGVAAVTVHGRTREQFYGGQTNLDVIKNVKRSVKIPVFANGDIRCREDFLRVMEYAGADGAVIGRAALGCPFIFAKMQDKIYNFDIKLAIMQHFADLKKIYTERVAVNLMKTHICYYAKNCSKLKKVRTEINSAVNSDELIKIVEEYFA